MAEVKLLSDPAYVAMGVTVAGRCPEIMDGIDLIKAAAADTDTARERFSTPAHFANVTGTTPWTERPGLAGRTSMLRRNNIKRLRFPLAEGLRYEAYDLSQIPASAWTYTTPTASGPSGSASIHGWPIWAGAAHPGPGTGERSTGKRSPSSSRLATSMVLIPVNGLAEGYAAPGEKDLVGVDRGHGHAVDDITFVDDR